MSINTVRVETEVSKGCPQEFCCPPGFWNIQYNYSLLNLELRKHTKAIAFANDFLTVKAESTREAENI
jgi:hypothetical protein